MADVRVMCQESPAFYRLLGLFPEDQCVPAIELEHGGEPRTYHRVASTPRWVLYRSGADGAGVEFDPRQR